MTARVPINLQSAGAQVSRPPAHRPAAAAPSALRRATIQYRQPDDPGFDTLERWRDHFALRRHPVSWWRRRSFWDGMALPALGAASGALIALLLAALLGFSWLLLALILLGFVLGSLFGM